MLSLNLLSSSIFMVLVRKLNECCDTMLVSVQQRHCDSRWRQCIVCSLWAGLQCYKLPSLFHQWKQVITPYPFTFLMGFSAMLRSAVMEHPLMKIHMASCLKISDILSSLSFFFFFLFLPFTHYRAAGKSEFSTPHAKVVYFDNVWRYANENLFPTHFNHSL